MEDALYHLVCTCGVTVTVPDSATGSFHPCKACGAAIPLPPESVRAALRREQGLPVPATAAGAEGARAPLEFGQDERLDLSRLERRAHQCSALAGVSLVAGLVGAVLAVLLVPGEPTLRALVALPLFLAGLLAWAAFRALHTSSLAALVLAERQTELLRATSR